MVVYWCGDEGHPKGKEIKIMTRNENMMITVEEARANVKRYADEQEALQMMRVREYLDTVGTKVYQSSLYGGTSVKVDEMKNEEDNMKAVAIMKSLGYTVEFYLCENSMRISWEEKTK